MTSGTQDAAATAGQGGRAEIAALVDHTLLKPEATTADVEALVAEARSLGVLAICVSPSFLPLQGTGDLVVATVCGFPSGKHASEVKAAVSGSGRADKAQVGAMVTRILRLDAMPKPADAADALALAITHIWRGGAQARLDAAVAAATGGSRR